MFYKSPLMINSENLTIIRELESIRASVDAFLELLVFTPKGGFKPDPDFGFEFWSNEFQNFVIKNFNNRTSDANLINHKGENTDKESCEKGLKKNIEEYEPRLKNVRVNLTIVQNIAITKNDTSKANEIKYDVYIKVVGELTIDSLTTEDYVKDIQFAVGPMIRK